MAYKSSAVYDIKYHFIWCTRTHTKKLSPDLMKFIDDQIRTIAATKEWAIHELDVHENHIHLFLSAPPFIAPTDIVKIMKGVITKRAFEKYPSIQKKNSWGKHIWSNSYYIMTQGNLFPDMIQEYLNQQQINSSEFITNAGE